MDPREQPPSVRVGTGPDGSLIYQVSIPPEVLPPVLGRDLERAWYAARNAALEERWGTVRGFRFARPDGTHTDLALADRDACCWVGAVDLAFGIGNAHGLSVCLRLLALVDLLARAPWARPMVQIARDGADLHPALLRTAAIQPLTEHGRFDETGFRIRLSRYAVGARLESSAPDPRLTGATP